MASSAAYVQDPLVSAPGQLFQRPAAKVHRVHRIKLVGTAADIQVRVVGIGLVAQDLGILTLLSNHSYLQEQDSRG